ncbi:MAG: cobalamin-binding protein [Acidiferrobacteraceae bacterium]
MNRSGKVAAAALALVLVCPFPAAAKVQARDDNQALVTLPRPAHRIISLAPHATEMLFAIGAGARVVGVSQYSDWPPQARSLPRVSGAAGLDVERILAAKPDLVIAWRSGTPALALQKLRDLGLPVFVSEPRRLADIPDTLERLGILSGHTGEARKIARRMRQSVSALRQKYGARRRLRVFYEIWQQPLMTIGGTHYLNDVLHLCGGENVFAANRELNFTVGVEAVLAARPDVILAGRSKKSGWQDFWKRWTGIPAVANRQLYGIPADLVHRPGPRLLQGARQICRDLDHARQTGAP